MKSKTLIAAAVFAVAALFLPAKDGEGQKNFLMPDGSKQRMKGAFFGHDHTNTFDGMDKNGIRIGMTKSINCGGSYGDGDPGLRVFRIRTFGSFESWTETEVTLR